MLRLLLSILLQDGTTVTRISSGPEKNHKSRCINEEIVPENAKIRVATSSNIDVTETQRTGNALSPRNVLTIARSGTELAWRTKAVIYKCCARAK